MLRAFIRVNLGYPPDVLNQMSIQELAQAYNDIVFCEGFRKQKEIMNQGVTYEIRAHDKASNTFRKVEVQSDKTKKVLIILIRALKNGADNAGSAWSNNSVLRGTANCCRSCGG